jgi:hypothetical protein
MVVSAGYIVRGGGLLLTGVYCLLVLRFLIFNGCIGFPCQTASVGFL